MFDIFCHSGCEPSRVYRVTSYGADPTGNSDSTEALLAAIEDAAKGPSEGYLMEGIRDLGGAQINLEGGNYLISRSLKLPVAGVGNLMVCLQNTILIVNFIIHEQLFI